MKHERISFERSSPQGFGGINELGNARSEDRCSMRRIVKSQYKIEEIEPRKFARKCERTDQLLRECVGRAESFDGKGHISQAMELGSLLPSRKSQDAAVGALVQMLKTAPPLCQDSSCSFNFSQAHNKAESSSNRIQPNKSSESESPAFQNSALDPGIASSGRSMLKTTADALEELRGFKEMKDMLLRQGGSQLPDCPDTARTVGRGSTVR